MHAFNRRKTLAGFRSANALKYSMPLSPDPAVVGIRDDGAQAPDSSSAASVSGLS